jgi:hypothetical protein
MVLDVDASVVESHSDKEGAAPTLKNLRAASDPGELCEHRRGTRDLTEPVRTAGAAVPPRIWAPGHSPHRADQHQRTPTRGKAPTGPWNRPGPGGTRAPGHARTPKTSPTGVDHFKIVKS